MNIEYYLNINIHPYTYYMINICIYVNISPINNNMKILASLHLLLLSQYMS